MSIQLSSKKGNYLSQSMLWLEMQKYYEQFGPDVWQNDIVPYQITTNKPLAHLYATLISAAINEYANSPNYNHEEPFYILELGAGHGKFSFYICKFLEFFNLYDKYKIVYIASDISEKNIDFWQNHPYLQKYLINQQLDFANFNAVTDQEIKLINSKRTISKASLNKTMFVIANYVFDSLSHDAFRCENNNLSATSINIEYNKNFSFTDCVYKYTHELINETNYYQKKIFNQLLTMYKNELSEGSFLLPVGSLEAIENIKSFSKENIIFLVADKGNIDCNDFNNLDDPSIAVHGSISFMVNFHALANFFQFIGGSHMITANSYTDLQIACFNTKKNNKLFEFIGTRVLYDINPQNIINLFYYKDKINNWHNLDQLIAILIISKWDPDLFYDLSDQLIEFIEKSIKKDQFNIEQEKAIIAGLNEVWQYFFKLAKQQDLPFVIGNIYYAIEKFELALQFFQISIEQFGETVESWHNIALCYFALEKYPLALVNVKKALQINSKYLAAKELLDELTIKV